MSLQPLDAAFQPPGEVITESKCATQLPLLRFDPHSSASAVITDVIIGKPL